jgi:hypothetical protein
LAAALFVLTVFIMVAALFSDPGLPINRWLNRYGLWLLAGEVGLLLVIGFLAMWGDHGGSEAPQQLAVDDDERIPARRPSNGQ